MPYKNIDNEKEFEILKSYSSHYIILTISSMHI
jgi:hypothetical protein